MAGFQHDIAGGSGNLIAPQIQSPNFNEASQTGWAILQNGDAFFYDITAAGSITSNTVIVSGTGEGVFCYSATPAAGNLVATVTQSAGTDAYGNAYVAGITSYTEASPTIWFATSLHGGFMVAWTAGGYGGPYTLTGQMSFNTAGNLDLDFTGGVSTASGMTIGGSSVVTGSLQVTVNVLCNTLTVDNGASITGGLTVDTINGSSDTGTAGLPNGDINGSSDTDGLPDGTIHGTSGGASTGTAHTHGPGSFAVGDGQHSHGPGSYAVTDGQHNHAI